MAASVLAAVLAGGRGRALADTDPLGATFGPRAVALGEALRAVAVGSLATNLNPAGIALTRSYVIEGTFGTTRDEENGTTASVSVCDSVTTRVAACLYYDFLDGDPPTGGQRRLHEAGLTVAMPLAQMLAIGLNHRWVNYDANGITGVPDVSKNSYNLDAGLVLRPAQIINIAFVGYNLIGDDDDDDPATPARFPIALGGGVALFPVPNLMVAADARWDLSDDSGRYGGGVEYFIGAAGGQQGFPLRAGYVYDDRDGASYVTGGAGYITPRVALDFGTRWQVDGGDERLVQVGLRLFLPTQ